MRDIDTFLTLLYVMADDFCKRETPAAAHPGPAPALSRSEVITLAVFAQWRQFPSERAFARWAERHLRVYFPTLPDRSQMNRQICLQRDSITRFGLALAQISQAQVCPFEVLDSLGVAVHNSHRRGGGWFVGQADIGWSNRLGWYDGFHVLLAVTPEGMITGYGFAPASTNDRPLTETLAAVRQQPHPRLPSVGRMAQGIYIADSNFAGVDWIPRWASVYGAQVAAIPQGHLHDARWQPWTRWLNSLRQIVESVNNCLLHTFGLDETRAHSLAGFQARLAAKAALHNVCFTLNQDAGRPPLAFAELIAW